MLLVFRSAHSLSGSVLFTDISAVLGGTVVVSAGEVIDLRGQVYPNNGIGGASCLRLCFGRKLSCP